MDYEIERRYFIERISDYVRALEDFDGEVHLSDDQRVLFCIDGHPFEALACVDEEHDWICISTRTKDAPVADFDEAVKRLQSNLQLCWEHCVAATPIDNYYELSMALFIGGCTFEAFESLLFNLQACTEALEDNMFPDNAAANLSKKKKKL